MKTGFIRELLQLQKGDVRIQLGSILNIARTSGDLYIRGRVGSLLEETWRVRGDGSQSGLK